MNDRLSESVQKRLRQKKETVYAGMQPFTEELKLFEYAKLIADRVSTTRDVLDFLFSNTRCDLIGREAWDAELRLAMSIDAILIDCFPKTPIKYFYPLINQNKIDDAVARLTSPKGTVVLSFHGGFRLIVIKLFNDLFRNGVMIQRKQPPRDPRTDALNQVSAMNDPGGALFVALRALMQGDQVFVAPDGPFGRQTRSINVLGVNCPVGDGAAFLAYESRCSTAWFTIGRDDRQFIPIVEAGPTREKGEAFGAFEERFLGFYADCITRSLSEDPRNLALSGRWIAYIREMLSEQKLHSSALR